LVSSPPPFLTNTLTQPRFHLKLETAGYFQRNCQSIISDYFSYANYSKAPITMEAPLPEAISGQIRAFLAKCPASGMRDEVEFP